MKKCKIACVVLLCLGASVSNGCTDSEKHTYRPKNKEELIKLVRNKNIKLDTIDTSGITDMSFLFAVPDIYQCKEVLQKQELSEREKKFSLICQYPYKERDISGIQSWNVSNVESMEGMFLGNKTFNESLNDWNVSQVKNMTAMFYGAKSFNQPLNSWNVSNVQWFVSMFDMTKNFNQPLDKWDLKSAKSLEDMFNHAEAFSQNLDS